MPGSERDPPGEDEMLAAERALGGERYAEATAHLERAARVGAAPDDVRRLEEAVAARQAAEEQRRRWSRWLGFAAALVGYAFLSIRQPLAWGISLWATLAFVAVPAIAGFVVRWRDRDEPRRRARVVAGAFAGGGAMALYTAISLIAIRHRIGASAAGAQVVLVGFFVTLVYAALAGLVAGAASAGSAGKGRE